MTIIYFCQRKYYRIQIMHNPQFQIYKWLALRIFKFMTNSTATESTWWLLICYMVMNYRPGIKILIAVGANKYVGYLKTNSIAITLAPSVRTATTFANNVTHCLMLGIPKSKQKQRITLNLSNKLRTKKMLPLLMTEWKSWITCNK